MGASTATALAALKIGGRVAFERLARPKARRLEDVPGSPYAITSEWLTAVLCGNSPGAVVTHVEVKPASAGTHERHQLVVSYNEEGRRAGLPVSIFTKSLPSVVTRMIGGFNGTARVEGNFYTQLRSALQIEAPLCYHSAYDRRTFAAIHLLEDMVATKAATFCNHKTCVSRAMADDMIDLLASLHSRFYGDPDARRAPPMACRLSEMVHDRLRRKWAPSITPARHSTPPPTSFLPRVLARRDDVWPATMRALALHDSEPQGLIHSDVHIGNWYRTGAGQMGLCDWQCLSRGHWSRDFAYAVTASLAPNNRRSWERDLLARYIERFAEQTGVRPDFDRSFLHYRQQVVHALAMWTITLCHSPLLPNMQPEDTTLTMIERITTAMADLESISS